MKSKVVTTESSSLTMKENLPGINEMENQQLGARNHSNSNASNPTHLPSLSLPINELDTNKHDPFNKEPIKNSIIAPVPMHVGVRVRADSMEALRKDSLPLEKMKPLNAEEASIGRPSEIFSTPEIRKSKSLTRKIKELSTTNRGVESPTTKELEALERVTLVRSASSASTPTISRTGVNAGMTPITAVDGNGKEQFLSGHNISLLRESPNRSTNSSPSLGTMQPIRLNKMNSSNAASQPNLAPLKHVVPNLTFEKLETPVIAMLPLERSESEDTPVYQHFSLPKSVTSSAATTSNSAQKNTVTSSATKSKPSSSKFSQYNNMECILVESEITDVKDDKSSENDRILQERLQQAKALGRKEESGAVLHSFSLWSSKPAAAPGPAVVASIATQAAPAAAAVQLNTSSNSVPDANTSSMSAVSKSASKLRGPKSARENQMLHCHDSLDNTQATNVAVVGHGKTLQEASFTTDPNISLIKLDASLADDEGSYYSDDDFVKDDDPTQDYSKENSDISNGHFNSKKALSLRSKVNGAKQLDVSFTSDLNKSNRVVPSSSTDVSRNEGLLDTEIADDLDCSYSSFACKEEDKHPADPSDPFVVNETSIHQMDDIMSDYSVEEDVVLARDLESSQANYTEFGTMSTVQTMMSRSGPAAFGATMDTSFEKVVIDPFAQTISLDPKDMARRASSGGSENKTNGMQYEPSLRMRSLTSRENSNSTNQKLERVSKAKLPTQAAAAAAAAASSSSKERISVETSLKATQPQDTKPSKYQVMRTLKSAQKKTGVSSSNSSIIESYFDQQSQSGDTHSVLSREIHNSSPLSELSDNEDHHSNHNSHSNHHSTVDRSAQEDIEQSRDDQAFSPLKWKKGEVIGEGTFGKVFKGLNEKTGELLAIKQICLADGSEKDVEEIRKEISVMWDLNHENIVRYMGTTKTDRYLFIIMEYVTGGSIASMLKQFGPFSENLMRRFAFHIISGVSYLHEKSIIHRDIKGANILVTDAGIAKLADFGCSKRMAGVCTTSLEESMSALKGSVPWMAPEVIKQNRYGRSSDIWSFGATMIEMSTGKPPWSNYSNNLAAMFHVATSTVPPAIPSNVSAPCAEFIKKCLVIDQEMRSSAQQLLYESAFLMPEWERINQTSAGGTTFSPPNVQNSAKKKEKVQRRPSGGSHYVVNLNGESHGSSSSGGGHGHAAESIIIGKS